MTRSDRLPVAQPKDLTPLSRWPPSTAVAVVPMVMAAFDFSIHWRSSQATAPAPRGVGGLSAGESSHPGASCSVNRPLALQRFKRKQAAGGGAQ